MKKPPVGLCPICREGATPPISPESARNILQGGGIHNQVFLDSWGYFVDDQEEQVQLRNHIPHEINMLLVSAVCHCGCSLFESTLTNQWKVVGPKGHGHIPEVKP